MIDKHILDALLKKTLDRFYIEFCRKLIEAFLSNGGELDMAAIRLLCKGHRYESLVNHLDEVSINYNCRCIGELFDFLKKVYETFVCK